MGCVAVCAFTLGFQRGWRTPNVIRCRSCKLLRADELLRGREQWYRRLIENSSDIISLISAEGIILWKSPSIERILGFDSRALVGRRALDMAHPDDRSCMEQFFSNVLLNPDRLFSNEFRHVRKDGSYCWVEGISRNMLEDPSINAIVFTYRDITERKQSQAALEQAQGELKRYAALLEATVLRRTSQLEEGMRSLQGVLYHVAHDLRAPLRAMAGYTSLLIERASPSDIQAREYGERIAAASRHMDELIGDLLEFGRLGYVEIDKKALRLKDQLEMPINQMGEAIARKEARLTLEGPMPDILAHARTFQQVVCNLIDNALKFAKPGVAPQIRVWTLQRDGRVRIHFQDNGIGIAPEYQEKIFGVFERLYSAEYPGTGIGLAIVRKGMERMGGACGVRSTPGQGSCFWIELPTAPGLKGNNNPP